MKRKNKGWFIVFEGIDGSGKSTQLRRIARRLQKSGHDVFETFEPTDGPVGKLIRDMLTGAIPVDQRTIASLFAADRTDHLLNQTSGIRKMVDQGRVVVCDRYYFSSYAYHAQFIDMDWVIHSNSLNQQILQPDATIFIDVPPEVCFERIQQNREQLEMYEKIDMMKQVRENYFTAFDRLKKSETVRIVDGRQELEMVEDAIWKEVQQIMTDNSCDI